MLQEKGINKKRVNWFIFQNVNINGIVDILNSKWFLYLLKNIFCTCKIILNKTGTPSGGGLWKTRLRLPGLTYKLAIIGICTEDWKQVIKLEYVVFLKWVHE